MRKPGCIEPVVYFRRPDGHLTLAPYSNFPTPDDAIREYADTLDAVDRLEAILQRQEREVWEREAERDELLLDARRKELRDRIYQRIASSETDEWNKEFYRLYLQLTDDKKARYRQRFLEREMYLHARHNDIGKGRRADEEVFNCERHTVKS
jgi:crotonobetainyl-CoA:carnitine CoA-transferase CaiB-like acyl-CoA transferase